MVDIDAQPNAFEEKIEVMIAQLRSKNAGKRREAAEFLGEAAAADAVPALVKVYQKDKNPRVRAAAAYSLGMYKAVERAINAGDEEDVVDLLKQIEEDGELGSRAPIGRTIRILIGLTVSLIILIVLFFMRGELKGRLLGSTNSHAAVVASVRQSFELVKSDTRNLQTELLNVIQNQPLSCIAYFNNPTAYHLDPADRYSFPDVAEIVTDLNTAQASLVTAKARYDDACNNGATFGATEAQETFQLLLPALQVLDPLELKLTAAEAAEPTATAVPPTEVPADTAVPPTEAPNAPTSAPAAGASPEVVTTPGSILTSQPPTVALDPAVKTSIKSQLPALFNIVDDVTAPRGASTLLVQYWNDVQTSGSTQGCSTTVIPNIPDSVFIPESDMQASADLRDAVQLINSGLAALRTDWTNFQFACNSNGLQTKLATELANANVAAASFAAAQIKLQMVQASIQ
ncbi:MAG: hypothetical protein GC204_20240 [Chloroflexi bacterium]|nr:hypothetical protein [Chloroflexota bacterium]